MGGCRTKRPSDQSFQEPQASGRQGHRLFDGEKEADQTARTNQLQEFHLAANSTETPVLSPGTPPEGEEVRLRLCPPLLLHSSPWAAGKAWRKLAEGMISPCEMSCGISHVAL